MPPLRFASRRLGAATALLALTPLALTACSDSDAAGGGAGSGEGVELRLGYFPNLTHAPAIVGQEQGFVEDSLGEIGATVNTQQFNSGTDTPRIRSGTQKCGVLAVQVARMTARTPQFPRGQRQNPAILPTAARR